MTRCTASDECYLVAGDDGLCLEHRHDLNYKFEQRVIAPEIRRGDSWRRPDSDRVIDARVERDLARRRAKREAVEWWTAS